MTRTLPAPGARYDNTVIIMLHPRNIYVINCYRPKRRLKMTDRIKRRTKTALCVQSDDQYCDFEINTKRAMHRITYVHETKTWYGTSVLFSKKDDEMNERNIPQSTVLKTVAALDLVKEI